MTSVIPVVETFFDEPTSNATHVISDPRTRRCAIIDSVLDFDPASGQTGTTAADRVIDYIRAQRLTTEWIIETHVHADHLTAAPYLKEKVGGRIAIGAQVVRVQDYFGRVFNAGTGFATDGSQFDHLFADGETYAIGELQGRAMASPGHTPACMVHMIGNALFTGDTLFMPDSGTARCDFPGGSARELYRSIRRVLALAPETRVFINHDYGANGKRPVTWRTTIADQRAGNIHVRDGVSEDEFVAMREQRDATLKMPRLILPSIQINMRAGALPPPEENGIRYLKLPIDVF